MEEKKIKFSADVRELEASLKKTAELLKDINSGGEKKSVPAGQSQKAKELKEEIRLTKELTQEVERLNKAQDAIARGRPTSAKERNELKRQERRDQLFAQAAQEDERQRREANPLFSSGYREKTGGFSDSGFRETKQTSSVPISLDRTVPSVSSVPVIQSTYENRPTSSIIQSAYENKPAVPLVSRKDVSNIPLEATTGVGGDAREVIPLKEAEKEERPVERYNARQRRMARMSESDLRELNRQGSGALNEYEREQNIKEINRKTDEEPPARHIPLNSAERRAQRRPQELREREERQEEEDNKKRIDELFQEQRAKMAAVGSGEPKKKRGGVGGLIDRLLYRGDYEPKDFSVDEPSDDQPVRSSHMQRGWIKLGEREEEEVPIEEQPVSETPVKQPFQFNPRAFLQKILQRNKESAGGGEEDEIPDEDGSKNTSGGVIGSIRRRLDGTGSVPPKGGGGSSGVIAGGGNFGDGGGGSANSPKKDEGSANDPKEEENEDAYQRSKETLSELVEQFEKLTALMDKQIDKEREINALAEARIKVAERDSDKGEISQEDYDRIEARRAKELNELEAHKMVAEDERKRVEDEIKRRREAGEKEDEEEDDGKGKKKDKEGFLGSLLLAKMIREIGQTIRKVPSADTGLDLVPDAAGLGGMVFGGAVGGVFEGLIGLSGIKVPLGKLGADVGKGIAESLGTSWVRHIKSREEFDTSVYGFRASTGRYPYGQSPKLYASAGSEFQETPSNFSLQLSNLGLNKSEVIDLHKGYEMAAGRSISVNELRNFAGYEVSRGISKELFQSLAGLNRMGASGKYKEEPNEVFTDFVLGGERRAVPQAPIPDDRFEKNWLGMPVIKKKWWEAKVGNPSGDETYYNYGKFESVQVPGWQLTDKERIRPSSGGWANADVVKALEGGGVERTDLTSSIEKLIAIETQIAEQTGANVDISEGIRRVLENNAIKNGESAWGAKDPRSLQYTQTIHQRLSNPDSLFANALSLQVLGGMYPGANPLELLKHQQRGDSDMEQGIMSFFKNQMGGTSEWFKTLFYSSTFGTGALKADEDRLWHGYKDENGVWRGGIGSTAKVEAPRTEGKETVSEAEKMVAQIKKEKAAVQDAFIASFKEGIETIGRTFTNRMLQAITEIKDGLVSGRTSDASFNALANYKQAVQDLDDLRSALRAALDSYPAYQDAYNKAASIKSNTAVHPLNDPEVVKIQENFYKTYSVQIKQAEDNIEKAKKILEKYGK